MRDPGDSFAAKDVEPVRSAGPRPSCIVEKAETREETRIRYVCGYSTVIGRVGAAMPRQRVIARRECHRPSIHVEALGPIHGGPGSVLVVVRPFCVCGID